MSSSGFTSANALSVLLTTESLLFAALSLAANLTAPTKRLRPFVVPGQYLAAIAVAALAFVAVGAGSAWVEIFVDPGFPRDLTGRVIAAAILTAITVQPLLALFLALGLRRPK